MEVWSGSVPCLDDSLSLEDLHLVSPHPNNPPRIARASNLQFVSLVDLSRVPLYLAAGPSLEVWTGNPDTANWIKEALSKSLKGRSDGTEGVGAWWENGARAVWQSQVGILLQAKDQGESTKAQPRPRVTELVLYGITSKSHTIPTPPSPPPSSSPGLAYQTIAPDRDLEVYALPISSDLLHTPLNTNIQSLAPLSPPSEDAEPCGHFLPTQHSPNKRKRAVALLDDAIKRRKNIQRKGGDGVGLLVTGAASKPQLSIKKEPLDLGSSILSPINTASPLPSTPSSKPDFEQISTLETSSRPSSIAPNPVNDRITSLTRPPSRKRSSLHRVSSSLSLGPASPLPPASPSDPITEQNKSTLSRIILAGMRLYGLSRSKERPASASASATDAPLQDFGNDYFEVKEVDEFKGVYHATYRAASFALRRSLKGEGLLEKEMVRSVVDQLLALFCKERGAEDVIEQGPANVVQ